jgi:hypothetical protein
MRKVERDPLNCHPINIAAPLKPNRFHLGCFKTLRNDGEVLDYSGMIVIGAAVPTRSGIKEEELESYPSTHLNV